MKKTIFKLLVFATVISAFSFKQSKKLYIVFIGDSITEARGIESPFNPSSSASAYLVSKGYEVDFKNQGRSGYTTVDFLPSSKKSYPNVISATQSFKFNESATLIFNVMLGTNDSAIKGPNGAPVSKENYRVNIKTLMDSLINRFPNCKIVLNQPIWYSDSTRNRSTYFVEGRNRLQSYTPQLKSLVKEYKRSRPRTVFFGDQQGYNYFLKNHLTDMKVENGPSGVFYLHPNAKGSQMLGVLWGKAIEKILAP